MNFMGPIPGMSLTKEPKNSNWETPPKFNTKEEVLGFYLDKLMDKETLEDTIFLLKRKFPIETFVDSFTSYGVMEGYHTIDLKVLVSPVLHEHIKALSEALKIKYVEFAGPSDKQKKAQKEKERALILIQAAMEDEDEDDEEEVEDAPVENPATSIAEKVEKSLPENGALIKRRPLDG